MSYLRTLIYLIILSVSTMLAGCSAGSADFRIGFSQCSSGPWRAKVNQEMLAAQHLYERDVQVVIANSRDNAALQARQIDSLAETGIDLLVVAPNEDAAAINEAVARVRRKNIPVVFFDRKTSFPDYTAFIGGDNVAAGRVVGSYVAALAAAFGGADRKPLVLEITGAMNTSPAQERHRGFEAAMSGHNTIDYECQYGDWTSDKAYRIARNQITTGAMPAIVFCHNDGMATGVYKAVVETKTEDQIKILGIDGLPGEGLEYVQFGHQVGTYVYPTHGERIVRLALDILTGKNYERENVVEGTLVTPENVELVNMTATELMKQNSDLVTIQDKLEQYLGLYSTQKKALWALGVGCGLLAIGCLLLAVAYVQTRKTIRQRQTMNEEQTLFYTDAGSRQLHDIFNKMTDDLPPSHTQDVIFAEQLSEAIRKHIGNPSLKMDDLGEEIGLSRVQLYRKVKAATGLSPVELLRQMRLQRAYALLTSTTKTVQEIAFEVGFNTPGYFSKCFRQQYGKYPMEVRGGGGTNQT